MEPFWQLAATRLTVPVDVVVDFAVDGGDMSVLLCSSRTRKNAGEKFESVHLNIDKSLS